MNSPSMSPRRVYRYADLRRLLNPKSVAIVGASPTAGSFGYWTEVNMSAFDGKLYLVNSRYEKIGDKPSHASLSALPEAPDCAVICVARDKVEEVVEEAASLGVGGVVIYAAGYVETGTEENIKKQERLTAIARASGLKIIGPNCIGYTDHARHFAPNFTPHLVWSKEKGPAVALVSQSGGVCNGLAQWLMQGIRLSHAYSPGNSCDVDCADFVAHLAEDPACQVIAMLFEGMASTERMIEAGEIALKAGKPLVVFKLGRGEAGAAAALSHSGFLAGSDAAYTAAFERMGAIVVEDFEHLMETAEFFAKAPAPRGEGAAIITVSGGGGVHAADVAEVAGVPVPRPNDSTRKALFEHMPDYASANNPIDVTAGNHSYVRMARCADVALADPDFGVAVMTHVLVRDDDDEHEMWKLFGEASRRHGKPVVINWVNGWMHNSGAAIVHADPNLGLFNSTRGSFNAIASWQRWHARRLNPARVAQRLAPASAKAEAAKLLAAAPAKVLTEREAKRVLALYGVPVVEEALTQNADEAAKASARLGFPVALKVESPDLPHKTEAGVIRLNLKNEADVKAAYEAVMANAKKARSSSGGAPAINGVLVQPMAPAGMEMMLGARIDPQFGPIVIAGLGGILVEVMKDTQVALAPVGKAEALGMLSRLRAQAALNGPRGMPPVDRDKMAEAIVRLSEFTADHADAITEIDVNPLICGERIMAVDALIVKR